MGGMNRVKRGAERGEDEDEDKAREAGTTYANEQVTSNHFDYWVYEQLHEAYEKLEPEKIARGLDATSVARGGKAAEEVAKNMLEQLRWDIARDLAPREVTRLLDTAGVEQSGSRNTHRAFWEGLRDALGSKNYRAWLAETVASAAESFVEQAKAAP